MMTDTEGWTPTDERDLIREARERVNAGWIGRGEAEDLILELCHEVDRLAGHVARERRAAQVEVLREAARLNASYSGIRVTPEQTRDWLTARADKIERGE